MPSTEPVWTPPTSFDQFVVERPLGSGGMGHVYLAREVSLDRLVALKFISSATPTQAARSRFLFEARALAKLSHPNVVGVYRIGEVDGQPYIAYEFVPGQSLDKLPKPIGWETVLRLAVGLARGLDAAHSRGILHRDIKPSHAVLSERGEIKLLDFGLAQLSDRVGDGSTAQARNAGALELPLEAADQRAATRPSMLVGTPAYLAPELWLGEDASKRSDIFALGLVLYELLVGELPHAEMDSDEMARTIVSGKLPPLRSLRPELPESLSAIVDRCLSSEPAERFPSATELRTALEEV